MISGSINKKLSIGLIAIAVIMTILYVKIDYNLQMNHQVELIMNDVNMMDNLINVHLNKEKELEGLYEDLKRIELKLSNIKVILYDDNYNSLYPVGLSLNRYIKKSSGNVPEKLDMTMDEMVISRDFKKIDGTNLKSFYLLNYKENKKQLYSDLRTRIMENISYALIMILFVLIAVNKIINTPMKVFSKALKDAYKNDTKTRLPMYFSADINSLFNDYNNFLDRISHDNIDLKHANDKCQNARKSRLNFLENISKDIRILATSIIETSQDLSTKSNNEDEIIKHGYIINTANDILFRMKDVHLISSCEAGHTKLNNENFYTRRIVEDLVEYYEKVKHGSMVNFVITLEKSMPSRLFGDYEKIKKILIHLLHNANKYTQEGHIDVMIGYNNGFLNFEFSDTGEGIDPEKQKRIFNMLDNNEQFKVGKSEIGIGLALIKNLTKLFEGDITVESKVNQGSIFKVFLKIEEARISIKDSVPPLYKEFADESGGVFKILTISSDDKLTDKIDQYLNGFDYINDYVKTSSDIEKKIYKNYYDLLLVNLSDDNFEMVNILEDNLYNNQKTPIVAIADSNLNKKFSRTCKKVLNRPLVKNDLKRTVLEVMKDKERYCKIKHIK